VCYTTPMRASVRVGVAGVLVAVLVGGCSSSSSKPAARAVARAAPRTSAELEARIVSKAPVGFVRQTDEVGNTGPSDLTKAAKDEGTANAATLLRAEQFVRGYQRLWIGPGHDQIIVFVYQFRAPAGVRHFFTRQTKDFAATSLRGIHKFPVPFLPPAQAAAVAGADKSGAAAAVRLRSGVFVVQVICNGSTLTGLQARALAIAEDQYRRL
jgi:hypothetical protein